jgi:hypothetical protein
MDMIGSSVYNLQLMVNLSKNQLKQLADISSDIGLISLVSIVIPAFINKFDIINLVAGAISALFFWYISLRLSK